MCKYIYIYIYMHTLYIYIHIQWSNHRLMIIHAPIYVYAHIFAMTIVYDL